MRIGEALGLRHEDLAAADREVMITLRATTTAPGRSQNHVGEDERYRGETQRAIALVEGTSLCRR